MSSKDQYDVLEALGTGSFGSVHKIRRKQDGKILVWKEINFGGMSEKEKTQLVAEVNILRELRNPFVVRYHDRIVDKPRTRLYIIMEYCSGGDLGKVIKRARSNRTHIEETFVWKIFAQAVLALKDCHRRVENGECKPILHRDLKPANILLDSDQNIKMADFGLAKELSSESKLAQTNVGTPFYMAPEIINEKSYDEKSDIWSLGCLLYELAALKPPFDASNAVTLAMKINQGKFMRIPTRYSDALQDAIKMMLQLDAKKRPRVEELEALTSLQPALTNARGQVQEFKFQLGYTTKMRELKAKEEALQAKEEKLQQLEVQLQEKEKQLQRREQVLQSQEKERNKRRMSYEMVVDEEDPLGLGGDMAGGYTADDTAAASNEFNKGPISFTNALNKPFEIHCDFGVKPSPAAPLDLPPSSVLPPPPPTSTSIHHLRLAARKPLPSNITTGSEYAKENLNPFKPSVKAYVPVGKENDHHLPVKNKKDFDQENNMLVDMMSPTKKPRIPSTDYNKPFAKGLGNNNFKVNQQTNNALPTTVQIDLDALLRPKHNR